MGTKSALKTTRRAEKKQAQRRPLQSQVRSFIAQAQKLLSREDPTAQAAVLQAIQALDKAARKGIIHPNTAARHKSILTKKLNPIAQKKRRPRSPKPKLSPPASAHPAPS